MKKIGIDISQQRSAAIHKEDLDWADYVLVMTPTHAKKLRARFPPMMTKYLSWRKFWWHDENRRSCWKMDFCVSFPPCRKDVRKINH